MILCRISQIVSLSYVLVLKVLVGAILGGVIFRGPVHNAYLNTPNVFASILNIQIYVFAPILNVLYLYLRFLSGTEELWELLAETDNAS